jgi:hypothetical protein
MSDRELLPWGGEVTVPRFIRRMLRRPKDPGDTPERRHEARQRQYPDVSVAENADRAIFGAWSEGHPGNRRHSGG